MRHLIRHVHKTWPNTPIWMRKLHRVGPVGGASCERADLSSRSDKAIDRALRAQTIGGTRVTQMKHLRRNFLTSSPTFASIRYARCRNKLPGTKGFRLSTLERFGKGGRAINRWCTRSWYAQVWPVCRRQVLMVSCRSSSPVGPHIRKRCCITSTWSTWDETSGSCPDKEDSHLLTSDGNVMPLFVWLMYLSVEALHSSCQFCSHSCKACYVQIRRRHE